MIEWKTRLQMVLRMNWMLTFCILMLMVVGTVFIYSACYVRDDAPTRNLYQRQILWGIAGFVAYFGLAQMDYRVVRKATWWVYALSLVLLVLVLFVGTKIYGARRWLMFFGIGVQPSELAKIAVIFVLSRRLSRPGENFARLRPVLEVLLLVAVPCVLIMKEPDLGTSLVLLPVTYVMMFVAGVPFRVLGLLALTGIASIALVLSLLFLPQALRVSEAHQQILMKSVGLSAYHRERLTTFINPDRDPLGAGWNKRQSEIAIGAGGMTGKGYLGGTQNILGFLPRSVSPTDFIFSVIAEETGFVGTAIVLSLYGLLFALGTGIAIGAPDRLGRLLSAGVVTMIFFHVLVNLSMTVGLAPVTGIPLPLLSYGGSFMMIVMASLGLLQSVHIRSQRTGLVVEQGVLWKTT